MAKAVAEKLGGRTTPPPLISCFPKRGLISNSEKFIGKNFLGYPFFHSAYSADYQIDSISFQIFVIKLQRADDFNDMWVEYLRFIKSTPGLPVPGEMTVNDPNHGPITFFFKGNVLWGIIGRVPQDMITEFSGVFRNCIHE